MIDSNWPGDGSFYTDRLRASMSDTALSALDYAGVGLVPPAPLNEEELRVKAQEAHARCAAAAAAAATPPRTALPNTANSARLPEVTIPSMRKHSCPAMELLCGCPLVWFA